MTQQSLAATDSERTFILQRRKGSTKAGSNRRSSAYFADSDASEEVSCTGTAGPSPTPQRRMIARTGGATSVAATLGGGRRILEGIRQSQQGQLTDIRWSNGSSGVGRRRGRPAIAAEHDDQVTAAASVFYGSVRFPASRVALWNRRATGSTVTLTPESLAPILVLRQRALNLVASKLSNAAEESQDRHTPKELRWQGMLGSATDVLRGCASSSDPRAASTASRVALEITGVGEDDKSWRGLGGTPPSRQSRGGTVAHDQQSCAVHVGGVLLSTVAVDGEGVGGGGGGGGRGFQPESEEGYRCLLDGHSKAMAGAKSASPAVFTPLRLLCSLRQRRSRVDNSGRRHREARGQEARGQGEVAVVERRATLSLRAELIVPAVGLRLTPIAPLALLHTALYQSLLTRGAEGRPMSGLLTLNEGRRAVLLSDVDPLSSRAPIVGVWVSGRTDGGGGAGPANNTRGHRHGSGGGGGSAGAPPPSPFDHPYTFPACLRFLLGLRGAIGGARTSSRMAAGADPAAFLVLQLPGGVNGGAPAFFEACALPNNNSNSGDGSDDAETATTARAGCELRAHCVGFEQLDFAADVDVTVGGGRDGGGRRGEVGGGRRGRGGGGGASAERAVVIGRLRRVSNPSFAEPFRRVQRDSRRRRGSQGVSSPPRWQPLTPATPTTPTQGAKWHSRSPATAVFAGAEDTDASLLVGQDQPRKAPSPMSAPRKPDVITSPSSNGSSLPPRIPPSSDSVHQSTPRKAPAGMERRATTVASVTTRSSGESSRCRTGFAGGSESEAAKRGHAADHHRNYNATLEEGEREGTMRRLGRGVGVVLDTARPVSPGLDAVQCHHDGRTEQGASVPDVGGTAGRSRGTTSAFLPAIQGGRSCAPTAVSDGGIVVSPSPSVETESIGRGAANNSPAEKEKRWEESDSSPPAATRIASPPRRSQQRQQHGPTTETGREQNNNISNAIDLLSLDSAARDFLLAQQSQLLLLEDQLHRLQATMLDQQQQQQQRQHQQFSVPVRLSVEQQSFVSGPTRRPVLVLQAGGKGSTETLAKSLEFGRHQDEETARRQAIDRSAEEEVTMVEASTNTSFLWAPAISAAAAAAAAVAAVNVAVPASGISQSPDPPPATGAITAVVPASPPSSFLASHGIHASACAGAAGATAADAPEIEHAFAGSNDAGVGGGHPDTTTSSTGQSASVVIGDLPEQDEQQEEKESAPVAPGWTTQIGRRGVNGGSRCPTGSGNATNGTTVSSGVDDDLPSGSDAEEAALLELRIPPEISIAARPPVPVPVSVPGGERRPTTNTSLSRRDSKDSRRAGVAPAEVPAAAAVAVVGTVAVGDSDDDKASGTTQEEDEQQGECETPVFSDVNRNVDRELAVARRERGDSGVLASNSNVINGGSISGGGGGVWERRRPPHVVGRRGRGAQVEPIIPFADLVVVPRIEFGQLTDDELGSDLDEGETIGRIESKYLRGGSMAGVMRRASAPAW